MMLLAQQGTPNTKKVVDANSGLEGLHVPVYSVNKVIQLLQVPCNLAGAFTSQFQGALPQDVPRNYKS
jgi:hypothetical protein